MNPPEPSSSADPTRIGAAGDEPGRSDVQQRLNVLAQRCTRGDEDAFAELHDLTCDRVHGVVLRVLRDPSQSEEVTQEVYLEAWRTASRHDPERGSVTAWPHVDPPTGPKNDVRAGSGSRPPPWSWPQSASGPG